MEIELVKRTKTPIPKRRSVGIGYLDRQTGENLYNLIEKEESLLLDEFEGKIFMRGSCGNKPCKGHYQ